MNSDSAPTVLLVEDSEDDALLFKRAWRKAGLDHALHHVEDGQQALDYLSGQRQFSDRGQYPLPGLVLLDLKLPIVHGFEVLAWVRSRPDFDQMCVVVLSSSPEPTDVDRAYALGANSYLTKAVTSETLRELVDKLPTAKPRTELELRGAERSRDASGAATAGVRRAAE